MSLFAVSAKTERDPECPGDGIMAEFPLLNMALLGGNDRSGIGSLGSRW